MALFPDEAQAGIFESLRVFFASPEARAFFNAEDSAEVRASSVARHLCGLPQPWESPGSAPSSPLSKAPSGDRASIRILLTGCFDLMHAGHYNALRQAKAAFYRDGYKHVHLVAGVHSDEAIARQKGPPVIPHGERVELVRACKWVDEVADDLPYAVPVRLLDDLRCDYAVHGDDLPRVGSGGLFDEVMRAGRLRIVKRTEGTSTTELIGRLMSMSKEHQLKGRKEEALVSSLVKSDALANDGTTVGLDDVASPLEGTGVLAGDIAGGCSRKAVKPVLLPTISRLVDFHDDRTSAAKAVGKKVVYVPGVWDLFHVGHVRFLECARAQGDFLLVGAFADEDVNARLGRNYPLQTLHERALSLLACRHVDDVLLGAPWKVTQDMLTTMNISVVCCGATDFWAPIEGLDEPDPFELPRERGMLTQLDSGCKITVHLLAHRIWQHSEEFAIRQQKKESEEKKYTDNKDFVAES